MLEALHGVAMKPPGPSGDWTQAIGSKHTIKVLQASRRLNVHFHVRGPRMRPFSHLTGLIARLRACFFFSGVLFVQPYAVADLQNRCENPY